MISKILYLTRARNAKFMSFSTDVNKTFNPNMVSFIGIEPLRLAFETVYKLMGQSGCALRAWGRGSVGVFVALLVCSCVLRQEQNAVEAFLADRPELSLPLDVNSVPLCVHADNWTDTHRTAIHSLFAGCDSLWVFDLDAYFPISEVYRIPSTDFGLPQDSEIKVLLITSNSYTKGIMQRATLATVRHGMVQDAKLVDWGRSIIANINTDAAYYDFGRTMIDSVGTIVLTQDINRYPMPYPTPLVITKATYRINTEGRFQEVCTEGTQAVRHRKLGSQYAYLVDEFTWGKQPADSTLLPKRTNEQNIYYTFDWSEYSRIFVREPYYQGELLYHIERPYREDPRKPVFHIAQKYEFPSKGNNLTGLWVTGYSWEDMDGDAEVNWKPALLAFTTVAGKISRLEWNDDLPAAIGSYYEAQLIPSGTLVLRGSALDLYLHPSKDGILVDSLIFFDKALDHANNAYATAVTFGRADLKGTNGKHGTRRMEELDPTFLKSLTYNFRPFTELDPDYDADADYLRRMTKYFPNSQRNNLPLDSYFGPMDNNHEDPTSPIPAYLTPFFTSRGGMGERTNFRMAQLTSPYIMRTLLLISCYYKDRHELYLYTLDRAMNVLHQLLIDTIPRTAQYYYNCRIESTSVNTLTVTLTPRESKEEQMHVLTLKIDANGYFIQP